MARRRRSAPKRRRGSSRRRSPVHKLRRRSVYVTNRGRRRRGGRRHYRRNPGGGGIMGRSVRTLTRTGVVLGGIAVGRFVSNLIPIGNGSPIVNFAKGAAVAIAIQELAPRVIGRSLAEDAAVGALLAPVKDLVVSFVPQAQDFLGRSDQVMYLPRIPNRVASYQEAEWIMGSEDEGAGLESYSGQGGMGSYSGDAFGP